MFTPARIYSGRAPAPEATVFTATTSTIVKEIVVANTDRQNSVDVAVSIVPSGDTAGDDNRLIPDTTVAPGETVLVGLSTVMAAGDAISVRASAPDRATLTISAVEDSA